MLHESEVHDTTAVCTSRLSRWQPASSRGATTERTMAILTYIGIALQAAFLTLIPLYYVTTGSLPSEFTHDEDAAAQFIKDQGFKNPPLVMREKFTYWAAFGMTLPALAIAPRLYRVGPCAIMLCFYLSNPIYEKMQVEAAVKGGAYPMENAVVHALFASVFAGILLLPEPSTAKSKAQ